MIYVAQQGRPRIVLFGRDLAIRRPALVTAWGGEEDAGNDGRNPPTTPPSLPRLVLVADADAQPPRLLYRYPDRVDAEGNVTPGRQVTSRVSADLAELIQFLAHSPTPEDPRPGLGLTYSDVVGALYAFHRAGAIEGAFVIEEDLLRAQLFQAAQQLQAPERPETPAQARQLRVYEPMPAGTGSDGRTRPSEPLVVPLDPPARRQ